MSMEQAQAFIEKVKNDEYLQKRLSEAQDNETKLEIARQEGFEFTEGDIKNAQDSLTDEELHAAAGAQDFWDMLSDFWNQVKDTPPPR